MTLIMNLNGYLFGWASRVFPEDVVSHENTRRFHLRLWKLLKISLRYTLASHLCSFVICIAFTLLMVCFHFVPFSQEMKPPDNYYYTPWAVGFQYGCSNATVTFLAPLFLVSFIFDFKRSRVFWFVLLPLGIACVPGEALLGYYNYQFWAHRLQLYSYFVATMVIFILTGVWVACHFEVQQWIVWDFFKVGGTITVGIFIFNNCILPAFGIGFAPKVCGIALTPFTPDSNTPKWKTLLFRILGVPAFMQLTFFLMRHSAISSKVAAQERSHVYWCWGHAMNNIYLRLIAFELDTLEILISSSCDLVFQIFLTLVFVMPIGRNLKRVFTCCVQRPTRHSEESQGSYDEEKQEERKSLMDSDEPYKSEGVDETYGTFSCSRRSLEEKSVGVSAGENEDDTSNLLHENREDLNPSDDCENTCKINVVSRTDENRLPKTYDDDDDGDDDDDDDDDSRHHRDMFDGSDEKLLFSHDGSTPGRKQSSDVRRQDGCKTCAYSFGETFRASERACCAKHNVENGSSDSSSTFDQHPDFETIINTEKLDNLSVHLTSPAAGESTLSGHDLTENDENDQISDRKKTIIEIFFHSNTISKMVGIVCSAGIYTLMYRHRYVYDIGYVNQHGGVDAPIQITQITACICIPLVFEVISDIISNMVILRFGWFSVIPVWAKHGARITWVVGVSFLVMLPSILHGFIALPMADSCETLDVCTCQHIYKWLADKCNVTNSTGL